jgi:hypothetical protein
VSAGDAGRHDHEELDPGFSELGAVLAQLVASTPGAAGAVLTDDRDEPIDMARRPRAIDELGIQLAGAQVGRAISRLDAVARAFGLGACTVLVECSRGSLCSTRLSTHVLLTLQLRPDAALGPALRGFAAAAERLRPML